MYSLCVLWVLFMCSKQLKRSELYVVPYTSYTGRFFILVWDFHTWVSICWYAVRNFSMSCSWRSSSSLSCGISKFTSILIYSKELLFTILIVLISILNVSRRKCNCPSLVWSLRILNMNLEPSMILYTMLSVQTVPVDCIKSHNFNKTYHSW